MRGGIAARVAVLVLVAAVLQTATFAGIELLGGTPDLLLVTVVAIALLRGSITGATAGFVGGLLVDTATLGTLGVTSLVLTAAGYWAGRYGETTGRGRGYAPYLAVLVVSALAGAGAYLVHFLLGEQVSARLALAPVLPGAVLDVVLAVLVVRVCRSLLGPRQRVLEAHAGWGSLPDRTATGG